MRWRGIVAATTAAIALAASAPASAQTPPEFYGVVPQGELTDKDIERMGAGRVGTARVTLPWSQIDPTALPRDYLWQDFDEIVAEAARQDVAILPMAFSVPPWVSAMEGCRKPPGGPCEVRPPQTQAGLEAWRSFLAAAVDRYGPGGVFWTLNPTLPERPIRAWQIWNEQNSPGFYQPRPDVSDYAALLSAASAGIRAEDPEAEVVLGGLYRFPLGGDGGGIRGTDFLERLYAQPGIEAAFDGVAVHPYSARLVGMRSQVRRMTSIVDAHGDGQEGIWITEVGWASGGGPHPLNRGPEGQAERLRRAFAWFTARRAALNIRLVAWYAWRDTKGDAVCDWCANSGLLEFGSTPKPAWLEFLRFTGGR